MKPSKAWLLVLSLVLLSIVSLTGCGAKPGAPAAGKQDKPKQWSAPPAMSIDPAKKYSAEVTTSKGVFTMELFADTAPKTVNNFVFLSKEGFYDGVTFHRIVKGYIIQSGDPTATGMGNPGYRFEDELGGGRKYEEGVVAMANSGRDTNGSQFFIGSGPNVAGLNAQPNYTIFGKVVSGMETIRKIDATPTKASSRGELSVPTEEVVIKSIKINVK